ISSTSIGMFEQASPGYGEIRYFFGGRKEMSRVTTSEGVLEAIYAVTGVIPPTEDDGTAFRGHPLAAEPRGAAVIFFCIWPVGVLMAAGIARRHPGGGAAQPPESY